MFRQLAIVAAIGSIVGILSTNPTLADAVCGPGKHLATNAWACLPGDASRSRQVAPSTSMNNIGAGVALGGALFSIVQSLASQSQMTDDDDSINPILKQHANLSRKYNRQGLSLQRVGRFNEARIAFQKAANEAINGGSSEDSIANNRNAQIADALHWLRQGYEAEKAGKKTKANIAYQMGIRAAQQAGDTTVTSKLKQANDKLIEKGGSKRLMKSESNCRVLNGKFVCSE